MSNTSAPQSASTTKSDPPGMFRGVPGFVRAMIRDARRPGSTGYEQVGYKLAGHLYELEPHDLETDEWRELIDTHLEAAVSAGDEAAVLAFVAQRYPRVFEMIPPRRHAVFVEGFVRGFNNGDE